ncbi:hypothetical protein NESM_000564800 [Novymonas esmeraldas]|uniref:Uncharacterized protein n=1 Tax=Novymonas esmeraldas TaxID=1808958 RepID=A0AAW0ESQ1_9TRYP
MYRNVSRSLSPSAPSRRATKVDLESIEVLQDAWSRQYEMVRNPPPPPLLNSPRSLRACAMAEISPQSSLQKLSLRQHLFRVLGNPHTLSSLPDSATAEYKVLLPTALRCFREAAVGLGTSQEKLAAYIAYQNQEELRVPQLTSLRELRRRLIAGDVSVEGRRRPSHRQDDGTPLHEESGGRRRTRHTPLRQPPTPRGVDEGPQRSRRASASHASGDSSGPDVWGVRAPLSPVSQALEAEATACSGQDGEEVEGDDVFAPTPSPSGKLPYKPRDVSLLNSSYFANRSIQSNVSNPSGAPLPTSTPGTPSPSRRGTASTVAPTDVHPTSQKRHRQRDRSRLPLDTSLDTTIGAEGDASAVGDTAKDSVALCSIAKQDLSVVSVNSSQLEALLSNCEPAASSHLGTGAAAAAAAHAGAAPLTAADVLAASRASAQGRSKPPHTVTLFHRLDTEANVADTAPATPAAVPVTVVHEAAAVSTPTVSIATVPSAPPSLPLTPRGRRGYTQHARSASQLVPNAVAQPAMLPAETAVVHPGTGEDEFAASLSPTDAPPSPHSNAEPTTVAPAGCDAKQLRSPPPPPPPLPPSPPPVMTREEEVEGFVYYCANPSLLITPFWADGDGPSAVTVRL